MRICDRRGAVCIAFAAGMIVAAIFPCTAAIFIIAGVIVLAGLGLCGY